MACAGGREALVKCRGLYCRDYSLHAVQDYQGQTPRGEIDAIELGNAIGYCWEV